MLTSFFYVFLFIFCKLVDIKSLNKALISEDNSVLYNLKNDLMPHVIDRAPQALGHCVQRRIHKHAHAEFSHVSSLPLQ